MEVERNYEALFVHRQCCGLSKSSGGKQMKRILSIIVVCILMASMTFAPGYAMESVVAGDQEVVTSQCTCDGSGAYISETELTEHLITDEELSAFSNASLPTSIDISTSEYLPPVKSQRGGSCTAYSTCYAEYSYNINRYLDREANDTDTYYTPMWAYNALRGDTTGSRGITVSQAYKFLKENGNLLWSEFFPADYTSLPSDSEDMRTALNIRADDYVSTYIDPAGTPIQSPKSSALAGVKQILASGQPLRVSSYFSWQSDSSANVLYRCKQVSTGHSILIVGYNDLFEYDINGDGQIEAGERGAFKIMNSWGSGWYDGGFAWVMYDALNQVTSVSGDWEASGTRKPAFSFESNKNWFTYCPIREVDPYVVAELIYRTDAANMMYVDIMTYTPDTARTWFDTIYNGVGAGSRNGVLLFDYNNANPNVRDNLFNSPTYAIRVGGLSDTTAFRTSTWRLTDNYGNPITDYMTLNPNNGSLVTSTCSPEFTLGDLNYDGEITSEDVTILNRYLGSSSLRLVDLSNLQLVLADYNQDGVVDSTDLTLIQNLVMP